ncbi:MAG: hypothetical protein ACREDN_10360, partial [Aestuariivirga sp.]
SRPSKKPSASRLKRRKIGVTVNIDREHELTSKGNMIIATLVAIYVMIMEPWGFGIWWLLIIPVLWFASSLIVAMPFGLLKAAAMKKSVIVGGLIDWANYIVLVPATYLSLKWLNKLMYGW